MSDKGIDGETLGRIERIHALSKSYNETARETHSEKLIKLAEEHIEEIKELHGKEDPHYLTETGDLLILCLESLMEGGAPVNETVLKCCKRYEDKLSRLIEERKPRNT